MRKELFGNQELFPAIRYIFFWSGLVPKDETRPEKGCRFYQGYGICVKITAFTVFLKITEAKEVSFGQPFKLDNFLSVFSEESYIFENN
ncbi:hypothetical protein [Flavobacterium sp. CAN_S2]|uniref:hypothetical protein n=1 Tax=Flavobacterium sp. CAN_S2 TaxID=2787726 RepID=UPI0018C930B0